MSFELVEAVGDGNKRGLETDDERSTKRLTTDDDAVRKILDGLTNLTLSPDDATSRETCVGGEDIVNSRTDTKEWSSVALLLIKTSVEFAENGVVFRESVRLEPAEFLCASPLRVDAAKLSKFLETFDETDDAEKVQTAYLRNYRTFFAAFSGAWNVAIDEKNNGQKVFEYFDTLASRTRTLPVGQTLLRDDGFTNWNDDEGGFGKAWDGQFSCWTTPLFDGEDFAEATKTEQATVLRVEHTTHVVLVKRCVAGMVDVDAYESAQGRNNHDGTGFRSFVEYLNSLCELGDADDTTTESKDVFKESECTSVLEKVTDPGASLGRDRTLPAILQHAFSGSVHKYDKKSSLERAVVLAPRARARCTFSVASRTIRRYGQGDEEYDEAVRRSVLAHLVHPIQIACKAMPIVKPMKTHYAELFDPESFQKIFCVPAVCDVLAEVFDKRSAYKIEPIAGKRRASNGSVRPDVAYAYRKKNVPGLTPREILKGVTRLAHTGVGALRAISIFGEEFSEHPGDPARRVFESLVEAFDPLRRSSIVAFTRVIVPYVVGVRNDDTVKSLWSTVRHKMGLLWVQDRMDAVSRAKKFLAETNDIGKLFPNSGGHESPAEFLRLRRPTWGVYRESTFVHYDEKYWNDALLVPSDTFRLMDVLKGDELEIFVREHAVSIAYALLSSVYRASELNEKVVQSAMRSIFEKAGHDAFVKLSGVDFVSKAIRVFGGGRSRSCSTALTWSIDQYLSLASDTARTRIVNGTLGLAASKHASETCAVLLRHGADPDLINEMGYRPLVSVLMEPLEDERTRTNALATMSVLLEGGADPNLPDDTYGQTSLFYSDDVSVTRLLLEYGAKFDVEDSSGKTLVNYLESSVTGTERVVEFLKAVGGDEEARETLRRREMMVKRSRRWGFGDRARVVDVVFSDDGEKVDVIAIERSLRTTATLDAVTGVFLESSPSSTSPIPASGRDQNGYLIIGKSADGKFYATVNNTTRKDGELISRLAVWSGGREIAYLTERAPRGRVAFEKIVFNPKDSKTMAIAGCEDTVYVYRLVDVGGTGKLHALTRIDDWRSPAFSPDGLRLAAVSSRRGSDPPVLMITNTVSSGYARGMVESFCSSIRGSPFEREILDAVERLCDYGLDGSMSALGPDMPNLRTLQLYPHTKPQIEHYDFNFPRLAELIIQWWGPAFSFKDNDTVKKLVSLRTFYLAILKWEVSLVRENLSKVFELPSLREFIVRIPNFSLSKEFPLARVTRQTAKHVHPFSPRERFDRRLLRFGDDENSISKELVWGFEGEDGVDGLSLSTEEVVEKVYTDTTDRPTATHTGTQILAFFLARYDVPYSQVEDDPVFSENLITEALENMNDDDSVFLFVMGRVTGLLHYVADDESSPDEDVLKWTFRTVGGVYGVLSEEGVKRFREWFLSDDFEKDMREYGEHLREMRDNTDRDRAGWKKLIESGFVETTTTD